MGADSQRRFNRGRPRTYDAPLTTDEPITPATHKSHKKNLQRQRRREEQLVVGGVPSASELTAAASADAAARVCKALGRGPLETYGDDATAVALVNVLSTYGQQSSAVAVNGCRCLHRLCSGPDAFTVAAQAAAVEQGAFEAIVSCLAASWPSRKEKDNVCTAAARAMATMCSGVGAAARREIGVRAGALHLLISTLREWTSATGEKDELVWHACCGALRSLTRDSEALQVAALDAGANHEWLR